MSKIEKWDRWIRTITTQMYSVMGSRYIYERTSEIISSNTSLPKKSSFYTALRAWYADSVLMGVRRQLKSGSQSISLQGLLEDIRNNPEQLSREFWVGLWEGSIIAEFADKAFDSLVGPGATHLDRQSVERDLDALRAAVASCEAFADKRVAHYDKGPEPKPPTFGEITTALDVLDRLVKRYFNLITADELASTVPVFQDNWEAVFEQPWLTPPA